MSFANERLGRVSSMLSFCFGGPEWNISQFSQSLLAILGCNLNQATTARFITLQLINQHNTPHYIVWAIDSVVIYWPQVNKCFLLQIMKAANNVFYNAEYTQRLPLMRMKKSKALKATAAQMRMKVTYQ